MGSKLASSVLHNVQHVDIEHPEGWTAAQKAALGVIADAANYKTGLMKSSMLTLAGLSGWDEQTMRAAATRALTEGLCSHVGYFMGKSRVLLFPNPSRIGEPVSGTGSNQYQVPVRPEVDPVSDPVSDPVPSPDIPVIPVIPEQQLLALADVGGSTTARRHHENVTAAEREENGYGITEENVRLIFDAWRHLLRYRFRVELTTARRDVICHALRERRGTVEEIREALVNVATACPDREKQRCTDLPHILHRDRLADAIADDIDPDNWTSSPFGDGAY